MEQTDQFSIVVLPFLKTYEPVSIGSIAFRSINDTDSLGENQRKAVDEISPMLFLKDDLRLTEATYAIVPRVDFRSSTPDLEYLRRVQAVIAYLYTAPRHEFGDIFLSPEHASLAIFTPGKVFKPLVYPDHFVKRISETPERETDRKNEMGGYTGLYNFEHHFWAVEGSRLYGPIPDIVLNLSQNLSEDIEQFRHARCDYRLLLDLLDNEEKNISERVFSALAWFNSANARSQDNARAIVNLAIAFEALMLLPTDSKTERLTDSISLLLGRVPRLDVWAEQFYRARSEVVHEGNVTVTRFLVSDTRKAKEGRQYQSLLSYGRSVFQLCLGTLLTGAELSAKTNLGDAFITNEERFQSICKILSEDKGSCSERLMKITPIVEAIHRYQYVPEEGLKIRTIIGATKLAAQCSVKQEGAVPQPLFSPLSRLAEAKQTPDHFAELDAIREAEAIFADQSTADLTPDQCTVARLLHVSWAYLFNHYYWLKDR